MLLIMMSAFNRTTFFRPFTVAAAFFFFFFNTQLIIMAQPWAEAAPAFDQQLAGPYASVDADVVTQQQQQQQLGAITYTPVAPPTLFRASAWMPSAATASRLIANLAIDMGVQGNTAKLDTTIRRGAKISVSLWMPLQPCFELTDEVAYYQCAAKVAQTQTLELKRQTTAQLEPAAASTASEEKPQNNNNVENDAMSVNTATGAENSYLEGHPQGTNDIVEDFLTELQAAVDIVTALVGQCNTLKPTSAGSTTSYSSSGDRTSQSKLLAEMMWACGEDLFPEATAKYSASSGTSTTVLALVEFYKSYYEKIKECAPVPESRTPTVLPDSSLAAVPDSSTPAVPDPSVAEARSMQLTQAPEAVISAHRSPCRASAPSGGDETSRD